MSRSLGQHARHKAAKRLVSPEQEGRDAFAKGLPASANPYTVAGYGKGHAWLRGWNRAATLHGHGHRRGRQ